MKLLEVKDVEVHYEGAVALDRVQLRVARGEAVAVIGPNGAGKSTLLRAISGLVPARGEIRFEGRSLLGLKPHQIVRMGIVHCPEAGQVFGEMTVEENLRLGAYTVRDGRAAADSLERVYALFPRLAERRRQTAGTLSGGERQMLAIGRSLMSRPRLLMLDEPSLGLAPLVRERIGESLQQIHREWGVTLILVEQDSALALEVGQRVYVLDSGRVVREGTPQAVREDPEVREVYLGVA